MEERRRSRTTANRTARFLSPLLLLLAFSEFAWAGALRHYDLEAGDASLMLNEFSRQSDMQVLFDFNILKGMRTRAVKGEFEVSDALTAMLVGTPLGFDFVNDHTLAVTPKKSRCKRDAAQKCKGKFKAHGDDDEVKVAHDRPPQIDVPPGATLVQLDRIDIDRTGAATISETLRTVPEITGAGPYEWNIRGRESAGNVTSGNGVNFHGLGAESTIALLNGKKIAPSGNSAAFYDVSNIPLSIVDHVEMITQGGSVPYGPDGVGGIINFVTRDHFQGGEAQCRVGAATGGALSERQCDILLGNRWGRLSWVLAGEVYHRSPLQSKDRSQATVNHTGIGGENYDTPFGNPGTITDGYQTWAIPANQDGSHLTASELVPGTQNSYDTLKSADILPLQIRRNLFAKTSWDIDQDQQISFNALTSDRRAEKHFTGLQTQLVVPNTNPFYVNPTGDTGPVIVDFGFDAELGPQESTGRVRTGNFALGYDGRWLDSLRARFSLFYTYDREDVWQDSLNSDAVTAALADPNPSTALNPFAAGSHTNPVTLRSLPERLRTSSSSSVFGMSAAAEAVLAEPRAGAVLFSFGLDASHQRLVTPLNTGIEISTDRQMRNELAVFGQFNVPVIGRDNQVTAVESLDASIGTRISRYSEIGYVTTPAFTTSWKPIPSVKVRSAIAWFFRPASLKDLSEADSGSELIYLPDSRSATGQTLTLLSFGGNRNLKPEHARTFSVGIDYTPIDNFSVSATAYHTIQTGRADSLPLQADSNLGNSNLLIFEERSPTPGQIAAVCGRGTFYGPITSCSSSIVGAILHDELLNIDSIQTSGIDWAVRYRPVLGHQQFRFGIVGTYIRDFSQVLSPADPPTNLVNTQHQPLSLRMRAEVGYTRRGIDASVFVNFSNAYRDTASTPSRGVSPWTTTDIQVSYQPLPRSDGVLNRLKIMFSVQNLFAVKPPVVDTALDAEFDRENADLDLRKVALTLRWNW